MSDYAYSKGLCHLYNKIEKKIQKEKTGSEIQQEVVKWWRGWRARGRGGPNNVYTYE
jgi:hypothetical protein